ncbi:hypothetical protein RRG08_037752 [Elysia crispata]|uniref:Uncharacterized protein n=1 Tax=Elysia crispata TaxID=231223 RepID=A0AAE1A7K0_9GAST|nr:hypothetical protein RRG08_037752 [Elysia crispata]
MVFREKENLLKKNAKKDTALVEERPINAQICLQTLSRLLRFTTRTRDKAEDRGVFKILIDALKCGNPAGTTPCRTRDLAREDQVIPHHLIEMKQAETEIQGYNPAPLGWPSSALEI